jgi:hypothetical protein
MLNSYILAATNIALSVPDTVSVLDSLLREGARDELREGPRDGGLDVRLSRSSSIGIAEENVELGIIGDGDRAR